MSLKASKLAMVPFVSVDNMMRLVHHVGIETFLADLTREIEADFAPIFKALYTLFDESVKQGYFFHALSQGRQIGFSKKKPDCWNNPE